jgi:hypothetical protein
MRRVLAIGLLVALCFLAGALGGRAQIISPGFAAIDAIIAGTGIAITSPAGPAPTVAVSAAPNSVLAGPLVSSCTPTAGSGITITLLTNPSSGVGGCSWTVTSTISSVVGNVQTFTSGSGTYTTPANTKLLWIRLVGGGGGGSGAAASTGGTGGGAGGYVEYFTTSPLASYAYAVGAAGTGGATNANGTDGGNTTFGTSLLTGNGGVHGAISSNNGGAGGTATGGTINIAGSTGGGQFNASGFSLAGSGGASPFGGGASSVSNGANGNAATGYGSGGGGGGSNNGGPTATGGNGQTGIVIAVAF